MPRILLLSIFCFFLFGCEEEGGGLIERETDSSLNSSSDDSSTENGSSSSNGVFSITPYLNASVSTDSPTGTWVSVGSGKDFSIDKQQEGDDIPEPRNRNKNQLKVFVIKETGSGYVASACELENSSGSISIEGNSIEIPDFGRGTLTNNKYAETSLESNVDNEDYKETKNYSFKLAKISDGIKSIGNLSTNAGNGTVSRSIDCFRRDEFLTLKVSEIQTSGNVTLDIENSRAIGAGEDDIHLSVYGIGNDDYSTDVQYEFSESELQSMLMTFSGSNDDGQQLSGTLQLSIQ